DLPLIVCPTVIGVAAGAEQLMKKAPKLRLALIVSKSWLTGLKMYVARLGVARYVVPDWKPPWLQFPFASVVTAAGIGPLPDTRVKVIVTPPSPTPCVTVPETENGSVWFPKVIEYAPVWNAPPYPAI